MESSEHDVSYDCVCVCVCVCVYVCVRAFVRSCVFVFVDFTGQLPIRSAKMYGLQQKKTSYIIRMTKPTYKAAILNKIIGPNNYMDIFA